jgi:hypothetical protein
LAGVVVIDALRLMVLEKHRWKFNRNKKNLITWWLTFAVVVEDPP